MLAVVFFSDLPEWERVGVRALVSGLREGHPVDVYESTHGFLRHSLKEKEYSAVWVVAKDWSRALAQLGARGYDSTQFFVSLLDIPHESKFLTSLLLRGQQRAYPRHITFLTHVPMNTRFFSELYGFLPDQLVEILFPSLQRMARSTQLQERKRVVGSLTHFSEGNNLNYLVTVAHYLSQVSGDYSFRFVGQGPLYHHLWQMVHDLKLAKFVDIVESPTLEPLNDVDVLIYAPLRNHHFLPILAAAQRAIPVLSADVPGVERLLSDGKTGYIVGVHHVKTMGELALRFLQTPQLSDAMGERLQESVERNFPLGESVQKFEKIFGLHRENQRQVVG